MARLYIPENFNHELPPLPLEVVRFPVKGDMAIDEAAEALAFRWIAPERIKYIVSRLPNVRWIQLFVAGVNQALEADLPAHITVCKGVGIHEAPTAEMAVTLLLSGVRCMHLWRDNQKKNFWDDKAYGRQLNPSGPFLGTLEDARVVILGMGTIGLEIAKRLVPFGAQVEGIAQTAGTREGFVTHAAADMMKVVAKADAVVSVLPGTADTQAIINTEFLKQMQKHAWLVNVGRGTAVDEAALHKALSENWIAGAALDVTVTEPLPPTSPLWGLENIIIAPHVAGGGPLFYKKACALLAENARRFMAGEPLLHVVDVKRGY